MDVALSSHCTQMTLNTVPPVGGGGGVAQSIWWGGEIPLGFPIVTNLSCSVVLIGDYNIVVRRDDAHTGN